MRRLSLLLLLAACTNDDTKDPSPVGFDTDILIDVEAGPAQEVTEGDIVTLDGEVSGVDLSRWTQVVGPASELADADATDTTFEAPAVGIDTLLVFILTGARTNGQSDWDETTVLVRTTNLAPTVTIEAPIQASEGQAIVMTATAVDEDGTVTEIRWTQLGGQPVELSDATGNTTGFVAPTLTSSELLTFEVEASDDDRAIGRGLVAVQILADNLPPNVDAGSDQIVVEQSVVDLAGTYEDPDGTVLSQAWAQLSGPSVVLTNPTPDTARFTAPEVTSTEVLSFALSATDDGGSTGTDLVTITVLADNDLPVVDAGDDQVVDHDTSVTLAGSARDPDGAIVRTTWTQLAGPTVVLDNPAILAPGFRAPITGTGEVLLFQLEAEDDEGGVFSDFIQITVQPTNLTPVVTIGGFQVVDEQTIVTLASTARDPDGTLEQLVWDQLSGTPVSLSGAGSLSPSFTAPTRSTAEVLVFQFTATDELGAAASAVTQVTVLPVNASPMAEAGDDQFVSTSETVTLHGVASDPDGFVATTTWRQTGGSVVNLIDATRPTARFVSPNLSTPSTLTFELSVLDDEGALARDSVRVLVTPQVAMNQAPIVEAGDNQVVPSGGTVSLVAFADDPDGSIQTVSWTQLSGPTVQLSDDGSLAPTFSAPAVDCAEHVRFRLDVVDDDGASSTDTIGIIVDRGTAGRRDLPVSLDLESDDGGLTTPGSTWQFGTPTTGPGDAWLGSTVWATGLSSGYPNDADEVLCLPAVRLQGATDVTLAMRIWVEARLEDGLGVEVIDPDVGWRPLNDLIPAVDNEVGWSSQHDREAWSLALVPIPTWVGDLAFVRLRFLSNSSGTDEGAFIDEIRLDRESTDPDGDGIMGVFDEYTSGGTDPFVPDSDRDGANDRAELLAGTDPLNPADYPGADTWQPGDAIALELDDGGLATLGDVWEYGTPTSGPFEASSGGRVWATRLGGDYPHDADESLYLPPIDLTGGGSLDATLSFRIWTDMAAGDAVRLEVGDAGIWSTVPMDLLPYDGTDELGAAGWIQHGYRNDYALAAVSLAQWAGRTPRFRLNLTSNGVSLRSGLYVDDLAVTHESSDPDGDGISGVLEEVNSAGTDPFRRDTDADGSDDNHEISSGRNPLNPASFPGASTWSVGTVQTLESSNGGLVQGGTLFAWGPVGTGGPGEASSGTYAWATDLDGSYFNNAREVLYLPEITVPSSGSPVLGWRGWMNMPVGDGLSLEIYDDALGWVPMPAGEPEYDDEDALERQAWRVALGVAVSYRWMGISLAPYAGERVQLRFVFRSNTVTTAAGAFLDDFRVVDDSGDPDSDGLPGWLNEAITWGTDPELADTDGDGRSDGQEVGAGTDPLNPLDPPP